MTPDLIEIMARAFCREACAEFGEPPCYEIDENWMSHSSDETGSCSCVANSRVASSALEAEGWVVVPAEPTEAMEYAGAGTPLNSDEDIGFGPAVDCWRRMLSARPESSR